MTGELDGLHHTQCLFRCGTGSISAIRSTTGVFDLCPMNKYRVTGPDAQRYLDRLITRDASKIGVNRVGYAIWCDDNGQVIDDGTIFRLDEQDRIAPTNALMTG